MSEKYVIRTTSNYGMFTLLPFNRDIRRTKDLEASFRKYGWVPAYPMHVIPDDKNAGKYIIKGGHHRFVVAKKLQMPVRYIVCNDNADIFELEQATTPWVLGDYVMSGCRAGLPEYVEVKSYCDTTGISVGLALSMLAGETAGSGHYGARAKSGQFRVNKDSNHATAVKDIILLCKNSEVEFYNKSLFVQALSRVLKVKELDLKRLKSKIKLFGVVMKKKATLDQHLEQLEEIYNRNSTEKTRLPLKFLAIEAAKQRRLVAA